MYSEIYMTSEKRRLRSQRQVRYMLSAKCMYKYVLVIIANLQGRACAHMWRAYAEEKAEHMIIWSFKKSERGENMAGICQMTLTYKGCIMCGIHVPIWSSDSMRRKMKTIAVRVLANFQESARDGADPRLEPVDPLLRRIQTRRAFGRQQQTVAVAEFYKCV
jgi:hypothetical protein